MADKYDAAIAYLTEHPEEAGTAAAATLRALRHIASLEAQADGSVGMVDYPHTKALRAASGIARSAIEAVAAKQEAEA